MSLKTPILTNAAEMQRQHPKTFERPSAESLAAIKRHDWVKVAIPGERFWIEVLTNRDGVLGGQVLDRLVSTADICRGEIISFHVDNVYSLVPLEEQSRAT